MADFSFRTREEALKRFREETFDLLIIGGGITGAGVARDAVSRGLKVALVEKKDFAWGTSSRSSKLIHGGLRYLQNAEFTLVFEALSERSHLLKTAPHMVRPLPFFLPVYRGDHPGRTMLSVGLWLYDLLSFLRTPGFHRRFSRKKFMKEIPFLEDKGLLGGFRYYDASMWDDALAVETLRNASEQGAVIANYVEAVSPLWNEHRIGGFEVRDVCGTQDPILLRAKQVVVCAGPWTDEVGMTISGQWKRWLNPSKGIHLLFDLKRLPVPGAMVMTHPEDGRISFVIPRPDLGAGVVIVGTTDGPTPLEPEKAGIDASDVKYLMDLLKKYFPSLQLTEGDILSATVGVRPLMGAQSLTTGSEGQPKPFTLAMGKTAKELQKVSREHYIGLGPGGVVLVAGGKYTTHRLMAKEIVTFAIQSWKRAAEKDFVSPPPKNLHSSNTDEPVNPSVCEKAATAAREEAKRKGWDIPEPLWSRYGAEALTLFEMDRAKGGGCDLPGFPCLAAQLRFAIRKGMVMGLEDFFLRRVPLFASRRDHGEPVLAELAKIWAEERGFPSAAAEEELVNLRACFEKLEEWRHSTAVVPARS